MCSPFTKSFGAVSVEEATSSWSDTVYFEMKTPDKQKNESFAEKDYAWGYLSKEDAKALRDHLNTELPDLDVESFAVSNLKEQVAMLEADLKSELKYTNHISKRYAKLENRLTKTRQRARAAEAQLESAPFGVSK